MTNTILLLTEAAGIDNMEIVIGCTMLLIIVRFVVYCNHNHIKYFNGGYSTFHLCVCSGLYKKCYLESQICTSISKF